MKKTAKAAMGATLMTTIVLLAIAWPSLTGAHGWQAPGDAAGQPNPVIADQMSTERGSQLYQQFCQVCHGSDGRGQGPWAAKIDPPPPNLAQRARHHSDGDFHWKIMQGKGAMPSFTDILTTKQVWDLVNYLKSLVP